jgi:hypothetical protein
MTRGAWVSLVIGLLGLVLLVLTVLWSTGQINVPGPLGALQKVPEDEFNQEMGQSSFTGGQGLARAFRDRLLASIWKQQLVTITVHVALCDSRLSKVPNPNQGRGDSPKDNLYWGAMFGVETFFSRQSDWTLLRPEPGREPHVLRRVVFLRRVAPTEEWRQRGVNKPFDICLMAQAWAGPYAAEAMRAALMDAIGQRPPRVIEIAGRKLLFGSGSDLIGYLGYNALKDGHNILPSSTENLPKAEPCGVFFICASSEEYFGRSLRQLGLYPVLLTTQHIIPEAYVLYGLTEALAAGQIEGGFAMKAAQEYARYQGLRPTEARRIFVQ